MSHFNLQASLDLTRAGAAGSAIHSRPQPNSGRHIRASTPRQSALRLDRSDELRDRRGTKRPMKSMPLRLKISIAVLIFGLIMIPRSGAAQSLPAEGSRIRVANISGEIVIGTLLTSSSEDVTILSEKSGSALVVPLGEIRKMEWNYGRRRRFIKYFGIGLVASAGIFGSLAALMEMNDDSTWFTPGEAFAIGVIYGGGVFGVPVGIIAGLSATEAGWQPVRLPTQGVTVSIVPLTGQGGGVGPAISISHPILP